MAPNKSSTASEIDDDALTDTEEQEPGLDEFNEASAEAAADEFAAYAQAGKTEDVDKVRDLIFEGTKCRLGFSSAELSTPESNNKVKVGKEYIYAKFEINSPEEYVKNDHDFGVYFRLSAKASDPARPQNTAWAVSRRILVRIAAAVYGCEVTDPRAAKFDEPALLEAANATGSPAERRMVFFNALTWIINEEFVGHEFDTEIGVDAERVYQGRKYRETQNVGNPVYPGSEKRTNRKSAKRPVQTAA
jgi:hypothetical protein